MHHMKDMMLEPNPKIEFGESIEKMGGLSKCRDRRCSPSECHLTNIDLVLDPRQAPEHSKSPMFYKISLESFKVVRVGWKHLIHRTTLSRYIPLTLCRSRIEYMLSYA